MRRLMTVVALGAALGAAGPAMAQPRPGGPAPQGDGELRKLREEIEKVRALLKDLEVKVAKVEETRRRPAESVDRGGFGGGGGRPQPGGSDRPVRREPGAGPGDRGPGPRPGGPGPGNRGPGFQPGGPRPRDGAPSSDRSRDFERRLDKIIDELEQLRRDSRRP
ncbi:MAG: hypothetical protein U0746_17430 [Gemmataceae bacterium]